MEGDRRKTEREVERREERYHEETDQLFLQTELAGQLPESTGNFHTRTRTQSFYGLSSITEW